MGGENPGALDWTKRYINVPLYYSPDKNAGLFQGAVTTGVVGSALKVDSHVHAMGGYIGFGPQYTETSGLLQNQIVGAYAFSYDTTHQTGIAPKAFASAEGNVALWRGNLNLDGQGKVTVLAGKNYTLDSGAMNIENNSANQYSRQVFFYPTVKTTPTVDIYAGLIASGKINKTNVFGRFGITSKDFQTPQPVIGAGVKQEIGHQKNASITAEIYGTRYNASNNTTSPEEFEQIARNAAEAGHQTWSNTLDAYANLQRTGTSNLPRPVEPFSQQAYSNYMAGSKNTETKKMRAVEGKLTFEKIFDKHRNAAWFITLAGSLGGEGLSAVSTAADPIDITKHPQYKQGLSSRDGTSRISTYNTRMDFIKQHNITIGGGVKASLSSVMDAITACPDAINKGLVQRIFSR